MKNNLNIMMLTFMLSIIINSCTNGQAQSNNIKNLSATEFAGKIQEFPTAALLDVRTPEEYSKGHLLNSVNIDWKGNDFSKQIVSLDKSKPVMVYCLSGARSSAAASKMAEDGFKEIYKLDGGIMKWRAANLPESNGNKAKSAGMSGKQFDELLNSEKLVLIDFYADWCAPCKKMKPYLDEISKDMLDKVVLVRINADDNQAICKELKIDALPVLQLYRNHKLGWNVAGLIEKDDIIKAIQSN
ncbi:MAG TPA: thioredoxin domain-containing protein [Saprospiraceae bacterium]|nr:thioredoxin domain-containing protein [Saprospiraceae bacterium]